MIYVGIDIAKLNHFASTILSYKDDNIIIGLESTTHYDDNLVRYLVAHKYNVCVEPHQNFGHA